MHVAADAGRRDARTAGGCGSLSADKGGDKTPAVALHRALPGLVRAAAGVPIGRSGTGPTIPGRQAAASPRPRDRAPA
jgi:hypothetical protein